MNCLVMKISEVIEKNYDQFLKRAKKHNSNGMERTCEDVLHDVLIRTINKFKTDDVDEDAVIQYVKRTMYFESQFENCRSPVLITGLDDVDLIDESTQMEEF